MARYLDIFFLVGGNVVMNSLYSPHVILIITLNGFEVKEQS